MAFSSSQATVERLAGATGPASDILARRARLTTSANPNRRHDYVVTLSAGLRLPALAPAVSATLRYVPDKLVLQSTALAAYFAAIEEARWQTLEAVATAVLGDLNNELIPRWVHVHLAASGADGDERHDIDIEDHQPNWINQGLMAHLRAY